MTVADTTFLVDLMRGDDGASTTAQAHHGEGWPIHATIISFFELQRGLSMLDWPPGNLRKIKRALQGMSILPLDAEAALIGGQLDGSLRRRGETIQPEDAMIAGIALRQGLGVLTRDTKHFGRVAGLDVQPY